MSVRAQWGAAALVVDANDPLQDMDIADIATPIDLTRGSAEIFEEIKEALALESYLYRIPKITCEIKDRAVGDDIPCATCPHARPFNVEDPLSRLCEVGQTQAALLIEHKAVLAAERKTAAPDAAEEEALELAEVCLA